MALSPDGTRIALIEQLATGENRLATRPLDESEFTPLLGTEGAGLPFFSPDGQWIGFFADRKLKKVAVQGGSLVTLCDAPSPQGASWGDDDNIIAALKVGSGLSRIPSGGGVPTSVTELDKKNGERAQRYPQVLRGSHAVLVTSLWAQSFAGPYGQLDVLSLKSGERKTVHRGGSFGRYLSSGHLAYLQQNTLYAARFDLSRLALTGAPQPVLEDVGFAGGILNWNFGVSETGTIVYVSGKGTTTEGTAIFWLDSTGKTQPLQLSQGGYVSPRFSPDGKRLAFGRVTIPGLAADLWVKDLERDATSRVTSLAGLNNNPVWTPDGKGIVFLSFSQPAPGIYWVRADGSGEPQRLTDGKTIQRPYSFSPDGKRLAYIQPGAEGTFEIWTAAVESDRDQGAAGVRLGKAEPFLHTAFSAIAPAFSPDGRWLAYSSDETGGYEVYVRPFPGPGAKSQISTGGGQFPIWSRSARELFFLSADGRIMVAGYTVNGESFAAGKPQAWSSKRTFGSLRAAQNTFGVSPAADLAPDGKRFAVILYPGGTGEQQQKPITHLTVLLNFFDELKRRVPVSR